MPFNGAGTFTSLGAPTFPAVSGDFILASYFNATMNDVFLGLSGVLPRDGQASMAANLPMGGFKVTGLGVATTTNDALAYGQAAAVLAGLTVNTTFAMTGTMTAVAGTLDLTGATAVNVPLQLVSDDSNKAASTAFVQDFFLTMPSGTLPSVTGKSLYNLRVNAGETGVEWALTPPPTVIRTARTADTILAAADQGTLIDITSGTFSQTFTAAATLGSGWWLWYKNSGTGTVTLDPDAGELINGATTYEVPPLHTVLIQCTSTAFTVVAAVPNQLLRKPIFSTFAATAKAVSSTEVLEDELALTGLSAAAATPITGFGNSLFFAASAASQSNIATSPDADIWTLRAMPSGAIWQPATNGTTGWVASVAGATTTAKSVDGTTWVSGTALGGTAHATHSIPAYLGTTALVIASAATTCYTSPDNGATWNAQTLPAAAGASPFVVNSLFVMYNAGTAYYTSATGATGSWTVRALPITPAVLWQDFDGALLAVASGSFTVYRCTDGVNWAAVTAPTLVANTAMLTINGVYGSFSSTFGNSGSYHNGFWITRKTTNNFSGANGQRVAKNVAGTIFVVPTTSATGSLARIAPANTDAATAIFSA